MFHQLLSAPSADGHHVPVEAYVPRVSPDIDPAIRRPAMILFPGGGYSHLSTREAEPVALRFIALGYNVFIVTYRVAPHRYPVPMQDAASAVGYIRAHAEELHTDPAQLVVMGFSAGGHLAAWLGTNWQDAAQWEPLGLTPEDVKPNAMVLGYPVISSGEYAHRGSFECLSGKEDIATHGFYSIEDRVTAACPPTFVWSTFDDQAVPCENSLLLAMALSKHGVSAELHVFRHGSHGSALCNAVTAGVRQPQMDIPENAAWPEMADAFLRKVL